jgi:hypothetical protein
MTRPNWTLAPAGQYHPDNVAQLSKVAKALAGGMVPASVGLQAAALLADRARKLALQYRVPYQQGVQEALRETPNLRLGLRPILPDAGFEDAVTLIEASDDASD